MLRKLLPILLLASLLAGLLSSLSAPLPAAAQTAQDRKAAAGLSRFSFADLGQKDIVVRAIFDQALVRFPLAAGRRVEQGVLRLHLSHDEKLLPGFSELTVLLNDEPLGRLALGSENAAAAFVEFDLPPGALHPGENVLTFWFNLRLRDQGCKDVGSSNLWARIAADSLVDLSVADEPLAPDLSQYPAPYTTLSTLGGGPELWFILPQGPTSAELSAAAQIAAALGQAAQWRQPPLRAFTYDQLDTAQAASQHLLVISTAGRNPLAEGSRPGVTQKASPYNPQRLALIVSGGDAQSLGQAADLLSTRSAFASLSGVYAPPTLITPQPFVDRPSQASFADLGFEDRRVRGIGPHDLYYPIDIPYHWKTTSDAAVQLHFTHAPGLDADASLASAFVNGFKVADLPLTRRNAGDGRLVIQLSPRQLHPGRNWLHLSFDLNLPSQDCNFRYLEEAWVEISAGDSVMNLVHVTSQPPLDLHHLPSPLLPPAGLEASLFVLADRPSSNELTAMLRLSAKLGTYTVSQAGAVDGMRPRAAAASDFASAAAAGGDGQDFVIIGNPQTHTLLAQVDGQLPQPLGAVGEGIDPSGGRELSPQEAAGQAAYIQVLPAPWNGQGALLVVSALQDDLLLPAVEAFPTLGRRFQTQGNLALITSSGVKLLTVGGLAGAPLAQGTRRVVSALLIGVAASIAGVGWFSSRWNKARAKEIKEHAEEE